MTQVDLSATGGVELRIGVVDGGTGQAGDVRQVDPAGTVVRPNASGLDRRALKRRCGSRVTRHLGKRNDAAANGSHIVTVDRGKVD